MIDTTSTFISAASFLIYIAHTYFPNQFSFFWKNIDWGIIFFYLFEYILRFYISPHKLQYLTSWKSMTDIATILPMLFLFVGEKENHMLFNISVVLRSVRVVHVIRKALQTGKNEVTRQLMTIGLTVLTLIVLTAALIQTFEQPYRQDIINDKKQLRSDIDSTSKEEYATTTEETSFHAMIYFIVVTTATVGYGDIYPMSPLGQCTIVAFIILVLVIIPSETQELIRLMGMQSRYARNSFKA
jgi:hypothetical protein